MIAMNEHVIVLDFKMGAESVASVVSSRNATLPIPLPGSIINVGNANGRKTFVAANQPPCYFFTDYDVVVELQVEPADG